MYYLWQDLSHGTIIFDLVTLTLKFDLLLKNFNLGYNFLIRSDWAFILHMCIACDKTFHMVPSFFTLWPWPWSLTYFWKTLTLAITFLSVVVGLSYCTCVLLETRPFTLYHNFLPRDLDLEVWPTFEKLQPWMLFNDGCRPASVVVFWQLLLDFSVGVGAFVIGLSKISFFFSSSQNSLFSTCFSIFEQVENFS